MTTKRRALGWTSALLMGQFLACDDHQPATVVQAGRDLVVAQPAAPTYAPINFPGAARTAVFGINGVGTIVGDFSFTPGGQIQSFALSAGTFTELEFPKATFTRAGGINDGGSIVALYEADNSGVKKIHGFLTTIDFPGSVLSELSANAGGQILGRYARADGTFHLFVSSNGTFTSMDVPGAVQTAPFVPRVKAGGLNGDGEITSYYCSATPCTLTSVGAIHGFVENGGVPTSFDFPGAIFTVGLDVNSKGDIVGTYIAPDGRDHGFVRTP